jgi:hypothetical protein
MLRATFASILILATFMFGLAGPAAAQETKDADTKADAKKGDTKQIGRWKLCFVNFQLLFQLPQALLRALRRI